MKPQNFKDYRLVLFYLGLVWLIELINNLFNHQLNAYALYPRELHALPGIVTMHFLHWNVTHLLANTVPVAVLGFMVCLQGDGVKVSVTIMLLSGLLVWLVARPGLHAGASGLIMGYWGYLISRAFFERSLLNILLSLLTIALYGGIVFSLLDFRETVSFEGHLCGFAAGVLCAANKRSRLVRASATR